ncbi:MAG: hypothetical protein U0936_22660 [Planctomycetaceae bacterium]
MLRQLHECQKQKDGLEISAGRSGLVISRDLHNSARNLRRRMEMPTIGVEDDKELNLSIGQRDLSIATGLVGQSVKVRIGTHEAEGDTCTSEPASKPFDSSSGRWLRRMEVLSSLRWMSENPPAKIDRD